MTHNRKIGSFLGIFALAAFVPACTERPQDIEAALEQYELVLRHAKEGNHAEVVKWLRKGATLGSAEAQFELGTYFAKEGNHVEAFKWLSDAAKQGHAEAQFALAVCYMFELGVERNDDEVGKWLAKAAEQGHAKAQYRLGMCYEKWEDTTEALKWYRRAAKQNNEEATDALKRLESRPLDSP